MVRGKVGRSAEAVSIIQARDNGGWAQGGGRGGGDR